MPRERKNDRAAHLLCLAVFMSDTPYLHGQRAESAGRRYLR